MQGHLHVESLKRALVMDLYTVQCAIPSKPKPKTKQTTTSTKHTKATAKQKPQSTGKRDRYQLREISCTMTSCVSSWVWPPKMKQNKDKSNNTEGPSKRVKEATKLNAETGDPPSQDPRDHREQPFRHNVHPGTSKKKMWAISLFFPRRQPNQ